jgi:hypothetical protein
MPPGPAAAEAIDNPARPKHRGLIDVVRDHIVRLWIKPFTISRQDCGSAHALWLIGKIVGHIRAPPNRVRGGLSLPALAGGYRRREPDLLFRFRVPEKRAGRVAKTAWAA